MSTFERSKSQIRHDAFAPDDDADFSLQGKIEEEEPAAIPSLDSLRVDNQVWRSCCEACGLTSAQGEDHENMIAPFRDQGAEAKVGWGWSGVRPTTGRGQAQVRKPDNNLEVLHPLHADHHLDVRSNYRSCLFVAVVTMSVHHGRTGGRLFGRGADRLETYIYPLGLWYGFECSLLWPHTAASSNMTAIGWPYCSYEPAIAPISETLQREC
jgi:hypothetical protein